MTAGNMAAAAPVRRSWADRLLGFVEAAHGRALALLLLVSLSAFLPGFLSLQPMDRDEPRFAQATKQMLETGDLVNIRFQDEARNKKPVGIYWLQAGAVTLGETLGVPEARTTIGLYRLPSLLGAIATVLLTYWAALALVGRRTAFLAAAFMAGCILLGVEARLAKTDAVLTACAVAAFGGLARAALPGASGLSIGTLAGFWVAIALSVLVKGPVLPMVVVLAALALSLRARSGRWLLALRPWTGLLIVLLAVLPWFVAIGIETGGAFFAESVGQDMLAKVGSGQERHWGPPGYYLLAFFGTFWPMAPLLAIAVPSIWRERRDDVVAVCLAWIVPAWIVFELVPTKLPHYVLPLYAAIAILTARAIGRGEVGPHRPAATQAMALLPLMPLLLLAGLAYTGLHFEGALPYAGLPVMALAAVVAFAGWLSFRHGDVERTALVSVLASVILSIGVFGLTQPVLRSLKISQRLAETAKVLPCGRPAVATAGYREPSLVFLTGTDLAMLDGSGAADFLAAGACRMAFVTGAEEPAFQAQATALGLKPALVTRVSGFNINGGKHLDIGVYAGAR